MSLCYGAICGRGIWEGTMPLAWLLSSFQSLPPLPTSQLGPSGGDSLEGGFVYILGPCGSLQWILLWDWEFLPPLLPPQIFTARGFEAFFSCAGTHGVSRFPVVPPSLSARKCGTAWSASCCLALRPFCPGSPSLSFLSVWLNVSSLISWLSDFHTVQFFWNSGCFLFLNWLLSFFWLCEEVKHIYLCLHLGWKPLLSHGLILKIFSLAVLIVCRINYNN